MSYLPGFDYDIFISYSHVDDLGRDPWVERFNEELNLALTPKIGVMGQLKIWRDKRKIDGSQFFDDTIKSAIDRSALFLAITSNGYLQSNYCRDELTWFTGKISSDPYGSRIGDRSRIAHVLLSAIPPARWPAEFGRITGFPFHTVDDVKELEEGDDLGEATNPTLDGPRFSRQLGALAKGLYKTLVAFKERLEKEQGSAVRGAPAAGAAPAAPSAEAARAADDAPTIFVADVADSLTSLRKRIVSDLQRKGVPVAAAIPPPYDASGHEQHVIVAARRAALCVHLLDQLPGREIDGDPGRSYPQKQAEIVQAQRLTQLIWVPKTLDIATIEDEPYRAFLNRLENGDRTDGDYDFVRGAGAAVTPQILEKLAQIEEEKKKAKPGETRAVLLDTHVKDQLFAFEISKLLLEHDIQPYINPQDDDPSRNLDTLEARLGQVSSLAVVFGSVSEQWVRQRLGAALQLSILKNLALKSFCVVMVPPDKHDRNISFQVGPVSVGLIDNSASRTVSREIFAPLLGGGRSGAV